MLFKNKMGEVTRLNHEEAKRIKRTDRLEIPEGPRRTGQLSLLLKPGQSVVAYREGNLLDKIEITVASISGKKVVLAFSGAGHEVFRRPIYDNKLLEELQDIQDNNRNLED